MSEEEIYLTPKKAAELLGVHPLTLYRWAKSGKIKYIRTPGGRFRYPLSEIKRILQQEEMVDKRFRAVIYVRMYPGEDNNIVNKRIEKLKKFAKERGLYILDVIVDTGGGICSKRPGLQKLLELVKRKSISTIIVENRSDISSICYWIFDEFFRAFNVTIEEFSKEKRDSKRFYQELIDFLIEVLQREVT